MSDPVPTEILVEQCHQANGDARDELYRRYYEELWALAEREIGQQVQRAMGPDDVVASVFRTFFRRTAQGQYAVEHSGALRRLLGKMVINKIRKRAKKAEMRRVASDGSGLANVPAEPPTEQEAKELAEELKAVTDDLDPLELDILRLLGEGRTHTDVAQQLRISRWTIRRLINRLRGRLERRWKDG